MKKKIIVMLLAITMTAFAACGHAEEVVNPQVEAVEPSDEVEGEPTNEPETEEEAEKETEATGADTEESTEAIDEEISAETEEVEELTEDESNEDENGEYTFTEMTAVKYAKSQVNVRNLPSTDGEKVDSLKSGVEVTVIAQCNETGWYQIGEDMYVSNAYLVDEKPVQQAASNKSSSNSKSGSGYYSTGIYYEVYDPERAALEDEIQRAIDAGDNDAWLAAIAKVDEYLISGGNYTQPATPSEDTSSPQNGAWASAQLLTDILSLVNNARVEAGVPEVVWDNGLDADARRRAEEVSVNFNHDGRPSGCAENISGSSECSANKFFELWWNSEGHRNNMLKDSKTTISVAVYYDGHMYYAVMLLK